MAFRPVVVTAVRNFTALLRTDDDPICARLRDLLRARDVVPETAQAAWLYEDVGGWYGIVCTPARQVFEFGLDVASGPVAQWDLTVWQDVSRARADDEHVRCALALAAAGKG
jgi:hypothetical protein